MKCFLFAQWNLKSFWENGPLSPPQLKIPKAVTNLFLPTLFSQLSLLSQAYLNLQITSQCQHYILCLQYFLQWHKD